MKKGIACLLALLLLILPAASLADGAEERSFLPWDGPGFSSPEEAVAAYLAGLRDGDLDGMLRAFAWEPMLERATLRAYLETEGMYQRESWPPFPDDGGFLRGLNAEALLENRLVDLKRALYMYATGSEDSLQVLAVKNVREEADAEAIAAAFDPDRMEVLRSLSDVRILPAELIMADRYGTERMRKQMETYRVRFGADEIRDAAAVFRIGPRLYGIAPRLARYGDAWYIVSFSSPIAAFVGADAFFYALWPLSEKAEALLSLLPDGAGATSLPEPRQEGTAVSVPWEGPGFDSPEDAVRCYLDGLREGDPDRMLSSFAWGPMAERTTLESAALLLRAYSVNSWPAFPKGMGLADGIDRLLQIRRWAPPIRFAIRAYLLGDALEQDPDWIRMGALRLSEEDRRESFLALFETERVEALRGLEILRIDTPDRLDGIPAAYFGESIRDTQERYRTGYGADEMGDMAAILTIGGKRYGFFPQVARYGDRWYLGTEGGILGAVLGFGPDQSALTPLG